MKKTLYTFIALLFSASIFAQAPQSFKYQAIVRDANGQLIVNQQIGIRTSIIQDSVNGYSVYTETFSASSNNFGLVNINIGMGNLNNNFSSINWANGPFFIKIEMDISGGTSYQYFGTSQLLSVPYSLYSHHADSANFAYTSQDSFNPSYPDGFQNITPITFEVNNSTTYTVPDGKHLYILNIFGDSGPVNKLFLNGLKIAAGAFNNTFDNTSQHLSQPIIANAGDVFSTSHTMYWTINGYLIDY